VVQWLVLHLKFSKRVQKKYIISFELKLFFEEKRIPPPFVDREREKEKEKERERGHIFHHLP